MRALLTTIGSRGDVQPLVALALELRSLGRQIRLCAPPDFREWVEGLGLEFTPIGPEVRGAAAAPRAMPSPEERRQMAAAMVAGQVETLSAAARGCDVIVGATALQVATRSVAEKRGIGYVFAAYSPTVLPSRHHAPPPLPMQEPPAPAGDNGELWARDAERFNATFGAALDAQRSALGLPPVADVRGHMLTERPWLAADAALAPWPEPGDDGVFQTGAWLLADERPLPPELEAFLGEGEPPVYFGLGSTRAPGHLAGAMVGAARAVGRRAVVSRGWAGLAPAGSRDCLAVGEVNVLSLFRRVAAVVHHGGAGTTTAAALAGAPQVLLPQIYDQHYWARRVEALGVGAAHAVGTGAAAGEPSTADIGAAETARLTRALERVLRPAVADRARSLAREVRTDGARVAAQRLTVLFGGA